jgi:hypothetical protein
MALKDVAPLLTREFIPLMLDYDRAIGAQDIQKRYTQPQGLPWFAFIDGDGKAVITSTGAKGNVGYPWEPHEIAHFKTMLLKAKKRLTDTEIDYLIKSLEEIRKKADAGGKGS